MKDWLPSRLKCVHATIVFSLLGIACFSFHATPARAESLESLLPYVIENHDRVRASKARLTAARNRAREALGSWYPTLSQTANAGHERQQNDNSADTSSGFHEWDISLTQLLWDFGSTNAAIDKARLKIEEARYGLIETRQSLILEAITAYMNAIRSNAALKFAIESEENIRRQTGLEEAMVDLGSGFSTDVLQAKTQLAGAQARRAQSEGGLANAISRFKAVYGVIPGSVEALEKVPYPASYLPQTLTQATDIAFETNPSLKNAILASDIAIEDVRAARADNFAPTFNATAERKFKRNVSGTIGPKLESLAKIEMKFDFNLGFTAVNTLRASESDLSATTFTAADTRRKIEEQVRNAWQQLDTAKKTASHLTNQANIAAAFLELARNERQLGRRSLIDVLSGETNLINAKSDALSAETDVIIAAYGLLAATGQLEYDVIKNSKGVTAPTAVLPSSGPSTDSPAAAPTLPVTPATGQNNGEIEPDVTVAGGRSAKDLQAAFAAVSEPNVATLPDTIVTYGKAQSGLPIMKTNSLPEPKSRFASFDQFKMHNEDPALSEKKPDPEFASTDTASIYALGEGATLPSDSDTSVALSSERDTADTAMNVAEPDPLSDVSLDDDMADDPATEVAEADPGPPEASAQPLSLANIFDILGAAHQAFLDEQAQADQASAEAVSSAPQLASIPEETEVQAFDDGPLLPPAPKADPTSLSEDNHTTSSDPLSALFGNIATFLTQPKTLSNPAQADTAPEETKPEAQQVAVNENPLEVAVIAPVDETAVLSDASVATSKSPLVDLFSFLEAAHQRALLDEKTKRESVPLLSNAKRTVPDDNTQVSKATDEPTAVADTPQTAKTSGLDSLIGQIFGSDNGVKGIHFEPDTIVQDQLSDRG